MAWTARACRVLRAGRAGWAVRPQGWRLGVAGGAWL